ncbi:MAG: hypothetical protein AB7N76_29060 [Planctomycetota bacterium]
MSLFRRRPPAPSQPQARPGEFRIAREVQERGTPYEGERVERIEVGDGCFSRGFWARERGDSSGSSSSGVEEVRVEGEELWVRHADGREEREPLPVRSWLATRTELLRPAFAWCIHDAGLALLAGLPVRALDLRAAALSGAGFAALADLPALEDLRVYALPPGAARGIARAPALRRLELPSTTCDADLAELAPAPTLAEVVIQAPEAPWLTTSIGDAGAASLARLRALARLDLSGCVGLSPSACARLRGLGLERLRLPPGEDGARR